MMTPTGQGVPEYLDPIFGRAVEVVALLMGVNGMA